MVLAYAAANYMKEMSGGLTLKERQQVDGGAVFELKLMLPETDELEHIL